MDTPGSPQLSTLAEAVVKAINKKENPNHEPKITVNRFVSELASWYEKLRNAMDIRDDEVVLRNAIERILKRRFLLGQQAKTIAEPLLRELVWARYFPSGTIPESTITHVIQLIELYRELKNSVAKEQELSQGTLDEWIVHLMSCQIARLLNPNIEKNTISNFMYHIMHQSIKIADDTEETKDVQVYLAVRRAFARDDVAFLRYYLFQQIFGDLTKDNFHLVTQGFIKAYHEIEWQLHYKLKEKIYLFVKKQTPIFYILEDVLIEHKNDFLELINDEEKFKEAVFHACELRYKSIRSRIRRAIIRSVIFILVTKAAFAFAIEGTYEKWLYGHVIWTNIALNTGIPPLLMVVVSLFIKTPGEENSKRIFAKIQTILFEEDAKITTLLTLSLKPKKKTLLSTIFALLWLLATGVSFGIIIWILTKLHFNIISQGVFLFFIAIISFLTYRINTTAHMYSVDDRQGLFTPFIDFLFIPIVRVGMRLTEGISQVNIIIFLFDFLIEAPFKAIFGFFDQWFLYLHTKREDLE